MCKWRKYKRIALKLALLLQCLQITTLTKNISAMDINIEKSTTKKTDENLNKNKTTKQIPELTRRERLAKAVALNKKAGEQKYRLNIFNNSEQNQQHDGEENNTIRENATNGTEGNEKQNPNIPPPPPLSLNAGKTKTNQKKAVTAQNINTSTTPQNTTKITTRINEGDIQGQQKKLTHYVNILAGLIDEKKDLNGLYKYIMKNNPLTEAHKEETTYNEILGENLDNTALVQLNALLKSNLKLKDIKNEILVDDDNRESIYYMVDQCNALVQNIIKAARDILNSTASNETIEEAITQITKQISNFLNILNSSQISQNALQMNGMYAGISKSITELQQKLKEEIEDALKKENAEETQLAQEWVNKLPAEIEKIEEEIENLNKEIKKQQQREQEAKKEIAAQCAETFDEKKIKVDKLTIQRTAERKYQRDKKDLIKDVKTKIDEFSKQKAEKLAAKKVADLHLKDANQILQKQNAGLNYTAKINTERDTYIPLLIKAYSNIKLLNELKKSNTAYEYWKNHFKLDVNEDKLIYNQQAIPIIMELEDLKALSTPTQKELTLHEVLMQNIRKRAVNLGHKLDVGETIDTTNEKTVNEINKIWLEKQQNTNEEDNEKEKLLYKTYMKCVKYIAECYVTFYKAIYNKLATVALAKNNSNITKKAEAYAEYSKEVENFITNYCKEEDMLKPSQKHTKEYYTQKKSAFANIKNQIDNKIIVPNKEDNVRKTAINLMETLYSLPEYIEYLQNKPQESKKLPSNVKANEQNINTAKNVDKKTQEETQGKEKEKEKEKEVQHEENREKEEKKINDRETSNSIRKNDIDKALDKYSALNEKNVETKFNIFVTNPNKKLEAEKILKKKKLIYDISTILRKYTDDNYEKDMFIEGTVMGLNEKNENEMGEITKVKEYDKSCMAWFSKNYSIDEKNINRNIIKIYRERNVENKYINYIIEALKQQQNPEAESEKNTYITRLFAVEPLIEAISKTIKNDTHKDIVDYEGVYTNFKAIFDLLKRVKDEAKSCKEIYDLNEQIKRKFNIIKNTIQIRKKDSTYNEDYNAWDEINTIYKSLEKAITEYCIYMEFVEAVRGEIVIEVYAHK